MVHAWTGLLRWLRRPWAAVLLFALLGLSLWWRPPIMNWGWSSRLHEGGTGQRVYPRGSMRGSRPGFYYHRFLPEAYFVREGPGFRLIDPEAESWNELSRLVVERPTEVMHCFFDSGSGLEGVLAATRRVTFADVRIELWTAENPFTDEEIVRVRRGFLEWVRNNRAGVELADEEWARLRFSTVKRVETRWGGHVQSACLLMLAGLTMYSWCAGLIPWAVRLPARARMWKRERRIARRECPRCRYAIAGLAERKCPECGEEWDAMAKIK